MKVAEVLHMVGGAGQTSYASNSKLQEKAIVLTKPLFEESIQEICEALLMTSPKKNMVVADLGCSSGPNTFLVVSQVIGAVADRCRQTGCAAPLEIQFFLNDLPGNDFNHVFRSLDGFEEKMKGMEDHVPPHYVAGVPGSFYGRLFPSQSVHLFHSSFSLHWLSQIPQGLNSTLNKNNIYISETSPQDVVEAYREQFQRDFSVFFKSRFAELRVDDGGGWMILTLLGRRRNLPVYGEISHIMRLLAEALNDMVSQGIIEGDELEALNLPCYAASMEEVNQVIQRQGLFELVQAQDVEINWDPFDDDDDDYDSKEEEDVLLNRSLVSGMNVAGLMRAVLEPIIARHFGFEVGDAKLNYLFSRYADNISRHLLKEKTKYCIFILSLKKKIMYT